MRTSISSSGIEAGHGDRCPRSCLQSRSRIGVSFGEDMGLPFGRRLVFGRGPGRVSSRARSRSAARSCRSTAGAGCRAAGSRTSPCPGRLDPVALRGIRGSLRAEHDGRRAVGVRSRRGCRVGLAPGPGEALRCLQHRARLVVVERSATRSAPPGCRAEASPGSSWRRRGALSLSLKATMYCDPTPVSRMHIAGVIPVYA